MTQDLIEQLGVSCHDTPFGSVVEILNPMSNSTSVKGVFAADDTMGMLKQVAVSMADGLKAAAGEGTELEGEKEAATLRLCEKKRSDNLVRSSIIIFDMFIINGLIYTLLRAPIPTLFR